MIRNKLFIILLLLLSGAYILNNTLLMVLSIILAYSLIIFSNFNKGIRYIYFLMPLAGIFDNLGFKYLFNIAIFILFIRLIIENLIYNKPIINKLTVLFLIIIVWDIIITIFSNLFNINYIANISLYSSWLIFAYIINKKGLDYNNLIKYLFIGYLLSCILCIYYIFNRWGFDIPDMYRFKGLARDANYFATYSLILLFGSKKLYLRLISLIFGLLSTSKMFLLLLVLGIFLKMIFIIWDIILNKRRINMKRLYLQISIFLILIIIFAYSGLLQIIYDKYIFRFLEYDFTTGRFEIQIKYISQMLSDPISFLFGRGLKYRLFYSVPFAKEANMIAHNTYLDIMLGFGVIGFIIFIYMFYKICKQYLCKNKDSIILLIVFLLNLLALSYLSADLFAFILLLIMLSFKERRLEN